MLRTLLLFLTTLAFAVTATAQNLVTNSSFEDASICDPLPPLEYEYMLGLARPWFSPNTATPDIYDCDLERRCGVPMDPDDEFLPFQSAQDGDRLAGAYQWFGPGVVPPAQDTREYLMVRLAEPLVAQRTYRVSLWYSRAEGFRYAVDHIGVHFGMDSIAVGHPTILGVTPQVRLRDPSNTYLTEVNTWVLLTDQYLAAGGEYWMVIGTFESSDQVDGIQTSDDPGYPSAYYYFDAISVEPMGDTGIEVLHTSYVGGGMLILDWLLGSSLERLRVMDLSGRVVMERSSNWQNGRYTVELPSGLSVGIYAVEAITAGHRWVSRFIKEEGVF